MLGFEALSEAPLSTIPEAGAAAVVGTGAATTPVATLSAAATVAAIANGAATTPVATLSGSGAVAVTGSGAATTPVATLLGSGAAAVTGNGAATTPNATLSGSGGVLVGATGTATTPVTSLAGAASVFDPTVTGTATVTTPLATLLGIASNGQSSLDPFAGERYRKRLRRLTQLDEERRAARADEAQEVRREILALVEEAQPFRAAPEVQQAYTAVVEAVPAQQPQAVTTRAVRGVKDWSGLIRALGDLDAAIQAEMDRDEEDVELLMMAI